MAQNLQLLKRRIRTAKNIAQISKAMEMISASKIKRAQATVLSNKPYAGKITELTDSILRNTDLSKFSHPFLKASNSEKTLLIVISPDKGLCGSLNTNLFKKLLELDNKNTKYAVIGKRASQFCLRLSGETILTSNIGSTLPPYSLVYKLIEIINTEYVEGNVSSVKILFSGFESIFLQSPIVRDVLPIIPVANEEIQTLPYLFEPNAYEILKELLPYFLEVILYNCLIEAFTSEQAARMVAMQNAKNNALDIADYLNLSYNKARQERITNELLSLSSNN